jgi:hypothetical protein
VSREAMAEKGLADKAGSSRRVFAWVWVRIRSRSARLVVHMISILPS